MYKSLSKNFHNLIPYRCGSTKKEDSIFGIPLFEKYGQM
jgi:hypothetical protein